MSPLFGPSAEKLLETGSPVAGTVVGIEMKATHDDDSVKYPEFAVEAGGTIYGIRQDIAPFGDVRLGMPVTLRVDGSSAVIEWGRNETHRWKMLKTPPASGIVDDFDENGNRGALSRAQKAGRGATVTILELVTRSVAMGLGTTIDARVTVEPVSGESFEATIPHVDRVPGYATHLSVVGAKLPAWQTKGLLGGEGVMVDWPAAAVADPGVGRASQAPAAPGGLITGITANLSRMEADNDAVSQTEPEIPDYAKNIMKKFGVDPENFKN